MQRTQRTRRAATAAVVATVVLGACGSSSHNASSSTTAASSASTSPAASPTTAGSSTTVALSGGHASVSGPGVTSTEIKLGTIATTTGPVPGLFQKSADSMTAFANYVNSLGGIDGHKLTILHKDDAYSCVNYTNALKSLSNQVFAMVGTFSVEDGCGMSVLKAHPNLPNIEGDVIDPALLSLPNVFAGVTQPPGFFTTGYQWVKDQYPSAITHAASLYPTTATASAKSERLTAQSIGYKYVYTRGIGVTETNFTSDILRMKADNVQIVDITANSIQTIADFLQNAAQQNFHPDAVIGGPGYDPNLFKLLGSVKPDNLVMPLFYPMFLGEDRAANPALNTYLTWLDKLHPGEQADLFGTTSWAAGVLFAQAMEAAGKAGGTVTQAGLIQTIDKLGSFTADGLIPATNPGARQGPSCMVIVKAKDGKFVRVDPPTRGYECNGTYHDIPLSQLGS